MKKRVISLLLSLMVFIAGIFIVPGGENVKAAEDYNSTPFGKHGELHRSEEQSPVAAHEK